MRFLKVALLAVISLVLVGVSYERISRHLFDSLRPGDEEFVEVHGRKVHFVKRGEGGPTVIFQSGLGGDWRIWEHVQNVLAEQSTTISYDRAGLLWSDAQEAPKTLANIADELSALLEKTNCPKPYIVVGHSLAGITSRKFIQKNEVVGVVFVDVSPTDLLSGSPEELRPYFAAPPRALIATAVNTGALRAVWSVTPFVKSLPTDHSFNRHVRDSFFKSWEGLLQEAEDDDAMFDEAAKVTTFGDVPLTVIAATYPNGVDFLAGKPELEKQYLAYHRASAEKTLSLSSNSRLVLATKSDHYVPLISSPRTY